MAERWGNTSRLWVVGGKSLARGRGSCAKYRKTCKDRVSMGVTENKAVL
jgi:hypothetical protein